MIHITYKWDDLDDFSKFQSVSNLWEIDIECSDIKTMYNSYMVDKAINEFGIVISKHWLNICDHNLFHTTLTTKEYKVKEKEWNRCLKTWTIDHYILKVLNGKKLEFTNIK